HVTADVRLDPKTGVDMTTSAVLHFPGGATASVWCSFESAEDQVLTAATAQGNLTLEQPFGARNEAEHPYRLMVESFADSIAGGGDVAIPPKDSVANMRTLDRVRKAGRT